MNWNKNPPPPGVNPQFSSFHYNNTGYSLDPPRAAQPINNYSHKPGRPGGGWDQEDEPVLKKSGGGGPGPLFRQEDHSSFKPDQRVSMHTIQPVYAPQPDVPHNSYPSSQMDHPVSSSAEVKHYERKLGLATSEQPGVYEKILVEEITTPGGVRPRPPDKDLHEFVSKCKYLPCDIIIPLLISLLDNPQRLFKALCVVEKLVYEYESYAEVTSQVLDRIRSVQGNLNTQKVVTSIMARFGASNSGGPSASSMQSNIIDLF